MGSLFYELGKQAGMQHAGATVNAEAPRKVQQALNSPATNQQLPHSYGVRLAKKPLWPSITSTSSDPSTPAQS